MQDGDFLEFLCHFQTYTRASLTQKVFQILDNHLSHMSLRGIDVSPGSCIILLSYPLHCCYKLQPLDCRVFGPFRKMVYTFTDSWMRHHPKTLCPLPLLCILHQPHRACHCTTTIHLTSSWAFSVSTTGPPLILPATAPFSITSTVPAAGPSSFASVASTSGPPYIALNIPTAGPLSTTSTVPVTGPPFDCLHRMRWWNIFLDP